MPKRVSPPTVQHVKRKLKKVGKNESQLDYETIDSFLFSRFGVAINFDLKFLFPELGQKI